LPNIKSAKKRVLVAERNHARNVAARSAVRTSVKKARLAVANKADNAEEAVKAASVSVDKAVTKGIMHKNTAARRKSRLAKALNASKE
jgi:small subunit ribosomal protein S20